jgi:chromosome partitioning protein
MTQIIAITNPKGGVAKTTTAVSLGGVLAGQEANVLLIDLDPQSHLSLALGVNPAKTRRLITDLLSGSGSLYNLSRETRVPGLDIIPSRPECSELFWSLPKDRRLMRQALFGVEEPIKDGDVSKVAAKHVSPDIDFYDYVIMDCPPSLNVVTLDAMSAADLLIIPTQPEYFSANNLKTMMELIRQVRQSSNPELTYRILITMQDPNNPLQKDLSEQIRIAFDGAVFNTAIFIDPKLPESAAAGYPISHFDEEAQSTGQYSALAKELIQYVRRPKDTKN